MAVFDGATLLNPIAFLFSLGLGKRVSTTVRGAFLYMAEVRSEDAHRRMKMRGRDPYDEDVAGTHA